MGQVDRSGLRSGTRPIGVRCSDADLQGMCPAPCRGETGRTVRRRRVWWGRGWIVRYVLFVSRGREGKGCCVRTGYRCGYVRLRVVCVREASAAGIT